MEDGTNCAVSEWSCWAKIMSEVVQTVQELILYTHELTDQDARKNTSGGP